jgi:hypothetical protein
MKVRELLALLEGVDRDATLCWPGRVLDRPIPIEIEFIGVDTGEARYIESQLFMERDGKIAILVGRGDVSIG